MGTEFWELWGGRLLTQPLYLHDITVQCACDLRNKGCSVNANLEVGSFEKNPRRDVEEWIWRGCPGQRQSA